MNRMPDTHAEAWALLPFVASGRIDAADREWIDAHAQSCAECRAELAAQRKLADEMQREGAQAPADEALAEQRSFNKLWSRIEAAESPGAVPEVAPEARVAGGSRGARAVRWLAAAVVVQAIGLGVLGVYSITGTGATRQGGEFQTVTSEKPASTNASAPAVRLVFAPNTSIETVNAILTHQGLEVIAGPGSAGIFTTALSAEAAAAGASPESIAAVLSKDPHVSFAQPIAK
jgi:hypothetical protein